jgi:hypothetical protein
MDEKKEKEIGSSLLASRALRLYTFGNDSKIEYLVMFETWSENLGERRGGVEYMPKLSEDKLRGTVHYNKQSLGKVIHLLGKMG